MTPIEVLISLSHIFEPVAVIVLIWRSYVADQERAQMLEAQKETNRYMQSLVLKFLERTDLKE